MQDFNFQNPTKIIFGKDKISALAKEIPADSKVLMIYGGGSIKKNGVYNAVTAALTGFEWSEFSGVEPNPRFETLMKAVEKIRTEKFDYLLAVGGGSIIDGTKFVAAAVDFKGDAWQIVKDRANIISAVPFGAVLTLPATGSEMNSGGVVTKEETHEKLPFGNPLLFPQFSVLDPTVTVSLPPKQRANGVIDAFVHVMEQYATFDSGNVLQAYFAESILKTLMENGVAYYKDPSDYNAAANIMWAATMALNGLIGSGVPHDWATHMIGHELTAFHEIDHGRTLAIVMPGVWSVMREEKKDRLLRYAKNVLNITAGADDEIIDEAIAKTEAFFHSLDTPTRLADYHVPDETIDKIVNRFTERKWKLGENQSITPDKVRLILEDRK